MSIEMEGLRVALDSHQQAVAFQVDAFKVACESLEMQQLDYQRPHPKGERRASVNPRAGVSPPTLNSKVAFAHREFLGRQPVQRQLFAPLIDSCSDVNNRVPIWVTTAHGMRLSGHGFRLRDQ